MQRERFLEASAISVIPFAAIQAFSIISHKGSFLHFSKLEAAIFYAVVGLMLFVASLAALASGRAMVQVLRLPLWLFGPAALLLFTLLATALDPWFWTRLSEPYWPGTPSLWVLCSGLVATGAAYALRSRPAEG